MQIRLQAFGEMGLKANIKTQMLSVCCDVIKFKAHILMSYQIYTLTGHFIRYTLLVPG